MKRLSSRILTSVLLVCITIGLTVVLAVGHYLTRPYPARVGPAPDDLSFQALRLTSSDGLSLAAWFSAPQGRQGSVVLLHGLGADRRFMVGRARALSNAGYGVLLLDFRAHGESDGKRVSMGWHESLDVEAALNWLESRYPDRPVGIVAYSLGGAATLYSDAVERADAFVFEAVYHDLDSAIRNRLFHYLGPLGPHLSWLLTWQVPVFLGASIDQFSPAERIVSLQTPVMILAGEKDPKTTLADSRALFRNAGAKKEWLLFEGAGHQDFHSVDPETYESSVISFLDRSMKKNRGKY